MKSNRRRKNTKAKLKRDRRLQTKGFSPQPPYISNFGVRTGRLIGAVKLSN